MSFVSKSCIFDLARWPALMRAALQRGPLLATIVA
jgi:hypothetical protein